MEYPANGILWPLAFVALVLIILIVKLNIESFCLGSRNRILKYVLLNVKPEMRSDRLKEHLHRHVGLNENEFNIRTDKVIIKTRHKLTNQQWTQCENIDGYQLILVHLISGTKMELSENCRHEIGSHPNGDECKINCVSRSDKVTGTAEKEKYERFQIEGDWLNITLLLDGLTRRANHLVKDSEQLSCHVVVDDDIKKPLLKEQGKRQKPKQEQRDDFPQEDFQSIQCNRNKTEILDLENQLYDYVLEHCKNEWQRIISPEPFTYRYSPGSLTLKGQACMVSKAAEEFANLYQTLTAQLSECTYTLSEGIGLAEFRAEALSKIAAPMKTLMLIQTRNSFKLFGPKNKLSRVKEMLKNLEMELNNYNLVMSETSNAPTAHPVAYTNQNEFSNEQLQLNKNSAARSARNDVKIEMSISKPQESRIKVSVIKGDLRQQDTEVIVNPVNETLQHGGGAAKAIATAAGQQLVDECTKYIQSNGRLQVGHVMHTTAGNLRPRIKYVIHAAGPSVSRYPDEKSQEMIVEKTFFNCLKHANDQLRATSMSIPAISSGMLGISKDLVARSAFNAVIRFEEERTDIKKTLEKVNFVNTDPESTEAFLKAYKSKQSYLAETNALGNPEILKEAAKRRSQSADQPKRKRVLVQKQNSRSSIQNAEEHEVKKSSNAAANDSSEDDDCVICMESITDPKVLPCGHKFCKSCIKSSFEMFQPKCPSCGRLFGLMRGNQPPGTMYVSVSAKPLNGYENYQTIVVHYNIPGGIQDVKHPNPGQPHSGTQRSAYLPDSTEGQEVCKLLRAAFDAGLIFTVGRSSTTGRDNQVIWNDIHHKTSEIGPYGYPDPLYLSRVKEELKAKGIVSKAVDSMFSVKHTAI